MQKKTGKSETDGGKKVPSKAKAKPKPQPLSTGPAFGGPRGFGNSKAGTMPATNRDKDPASFLLPPQLPSSSPGCKYVYRFYYHLYPECL